MIPNTLSWGSRWLPTPGVVELVSAAATACQSVIEARKAEAEGGLAVAVGHFREALDSLRAQPDGSLLAHSTRAAAIAGLARILPGEHGTKAARKQALAWFSSLPSGQVDAADLADHAALLDAASPERRDLLLRAAATPLPPVWAADELRHVASHSGQRRLMWSVVRQAPLVAGHHVTLAELEASEQDASSELAIGAALYLAEDEIGSARVYAMRACELDATNLGAALLLADVMRLQDDADQAVGILGRLRGNGKPASLLDWLVIRTHAQALEALGRRRDALDAIEFVLRDFSDKRPADYVFAARLHTALGEPGEARKLFDEAIRLSPAEVPVVYASVVDWLRRKRIDAAIADVDAALYRCPQKPRLVVLRGYLEGRKGTPGAPEDDIAHAIALGANPADAWWQLSFMWQDQGDRRRAAEALKHAIEHGGAENADLLLAYGELLAELQNYDGAVAALRRAARIQPDGVAIYEQLTNALLAAGRPRAAVHVLDRALKRLPDEPRLLAWRGRCHRLANDLGAAERDLRQAIGRVDLDEPAVDLFWVLSAAHGAAQAIDWALDQLSPPKVATLAMGLWQADDTEAALALADAALARSTAEDPRDRAQLHLVQGFASLQLDRGQDIGGSLTWATDLLPDDAISHAYLAIYLAATNQPDEAEAMVKRARALDPGSEKVATLAVRALRVARGDERALRELDEAIFQIGEDLDLLALRAELLLYVDAEKALELTTTMHEMGATEPSVDRVEAFALLEVGRYDEAVKLLAAQLDKDPSDIQVRIGLARALNGIGSSQEALAVVKKIRPKDLSADVFLVRGQIRSSLGDSRCLDDFANALEEDPGFAFARTEMIDAACKFGKKDLARRHLDVLLNDTSFAGEPVVVRLAWVLGESDVALERAERDLSVHASAPMLALKAGILVDDGQYSEAIEAAGAAVRLDPASSEARYILSVAHLAVGSPTEALAALGEQDNSLVVPQRVACLFELGRSEDATALAEATLRSKTALPDENMWTALGEALIAEGMLRPLADLLVSQLDTAPSPAILRLCGSLLAAMGLFELAIPALEQARARDRQLDVEGDLAWAYTYVRPPRHRDALVTARQGRRRDPHDLGLLKTKADALLHLGQAPQARRVYRTILAQLPSSSLGTQETSALAGWCHYRLGNYDLSIDHLVRAVTASAHDQAWGRFDLGLALLACGNVARAQREYEHAVQEVQAVSDPLRRLAVLEVALTDLREATAHRTKIPEADAIPDLKRMLQSEVTQARKSVRTVRRFVARMRAVTARPA